MTALSVRRWRGLVALARDAVVGASHAVERVHLETARRPFGVLEMVPLLATPAAVVRVAHDATVTAVHVVIRASSRAVGATLGVALDAVEVVSPETASSADRATGWRVGDADR